MSKSKKEAPKALVASFLKDAVNARMDDQHSLETLPALMEVLLPKYDGKTLLRQPGKLTIRAEGPRWIIQVDCPTEVVQCRYTTNVLAFALRDIDEAIANDHVLWLPGYSKQKKKLPTVDDIVQ